MTCDHSRATGMIQLNSSIYIVILVPPFVFRYDLCTVWCPYIDSWLFVKEVMMRLSRSTLQVWRKDRSFFLPLCFKKVAVWRGGVTSQMEEWAYHEASDVKLLINHLEK